METRDHEGCIRRHNKSLNWWRYCRLCGGGGCGLREDAIDECRFAAGEGSIDRLSGCFHPGQSDGWGEKLLEGSTTIVSLRCR